jgi:hypothetical protein
MVEAANAFIASLGNDAAKRGEALLDFGARKHFQYTPGDRPGLPLASMSMPQQEAARALIKLGLSESGYTKAETIRLLELVLRAAEGSNTRDPSRYFLAVYGTPSAAGDWAWHWEGHHLSLHFTLSKCTAIADAPAFFGANPARVATSVAGAPPAGTRALAKEEDLARALAMALAADPQKRMTAIVSGQDREVMNTPAKVNPVTPAGLAASGMSPAEVEQLKQLVGAYAENMAADLGAARLRRMQEAGPDKLTFLWSGSLTPGQQHYYRVQGPTFMIEYLNAQGANHIHSVWRDFNGDFGEDLLQLHLQQEPH